MDNWKQKLEEARNNSKMEVLPCSLGELGGGWGMKADGSGFGREDGKFFDLAGFKVYGSGREVPGWGQPLIKEEGVGVVALICDRNRNFILATRQEPGNPANKRHVLLGASLQASRGNLEQAHGGKLPPRAELYKNSQVVWIDATGDGGRFFGKTNRLGVLVVRSVEDVGLLPNEMIMSKQELRDALELGEVNSHAREVIALAMVLLYP